MALTIGPDAVLLNSSGTRVKFIRDAEYDEVAPPLVGITGDSFTLLQATPDGKLKVDASVSIDNIDIGDVNMKLKLVGGGEAPLYGGLNPDALSYFAYVQDQRMTFTGSALNVSVAGLTLTSNRPKYYSIETSQAPGVDVLYDFGAVMQDVYLSFSRDVTIKWDSTLSTPVSLLRGDYDFLNQYATRVYVTNTLSMTLEIYANGGV